MPVPANIKIDVDGFEHKVVAGARETLTDRTVQSLLIEINPKLAEHIACGDQGECPDAFRCEAVNA